MASGARITLTSPDPSSNNSPEHNEHKPMIFSESDSDTVTFNAHKHKYNEMASHDASSSSAPSSSISFNTLETDESTTSPVRSHPQKVEITIDSVAPYETDNSSMVVDSDYDDVKEEIPTLNRADNSIEESEMKMNKDTSDAQDQRNQEKRTKNDEL